jgi:hypothetical protein
MGRVWEDEEATTKRDAPTGVEELMVKDLAVLSQRKLAEPAVVLAPVKKVTWLLAAEPESLLLKVKKSEDNNCPELVMLALGRLMTKELVEVVMLKLLPRVPVETLEITPADKEIWVEVPIKTFCPPVMERPEPTVKSPSVVVPNPPLLTANTPLQPRVKVLLAMEPVTLVSLVTKPTKVVPRVEELVPPLAIGKMPVISVEPPPRLTGPLAKLPLTERTIPVAKEEMLVEPLPKTWKRVKPEEEAMVKGVTLAPAWTVRVEVLVVVPTAKILEIVAEPVIPRLELVLFQRKLADEAVLLAPVA